MCQNHAFARYVLPVAESEIKNQEWPGKDQGDEDKKDDEGGKAEAGNEVEEGERNKDDKIGGQAAGADTANGNESDDPNEDSDQPKMTDEQRAFLDKLLAEMRLIESFKNNTGEPKGELELLDQDALKQLESRLSIDDQCVSRLSQSVCSNPTFDRRFGSGAHRTLGFLALPLSFVSLGSTLSTQSRTYESYTTLE